MPSALQTFGLPPFTKAVKRLIIVNVAVWVVLLFARLTVPVVDRWADYYLILRPVAVVFHFEFWQLITYSFLHDPHGISHLLFNMLGIWMFGSQFEMDYGKRRFYELYFWCVAGAAVTTIAIGALGMFAYHQLPIGLFRVMAQIWGTATLGASGGVYGLLVAFAVLNGNRALYVYGLVPVKARYLAIFYLFLSFVNAFSGANGVAEFAHLGGALFAWIYLRYLPRYGLQTAASEGLFGVRNAYYRWKRRRAARKFEVYMRKTNRREYFDDKGNYHGPRLDKDDDRWVN